MRNARSLNFSMKNLNNVSEEVFADALWAEVNSVDLSTNRFVHVPIGYVRYF